MTNQSEEEIIPSHSPVGIGLNGRRGFHPRDRGKSVVHALAEETVPTQALATLWCRLRNSQCRDTGSGSGRQLPSPAAAGTLGDQAVTKVSARTSSISTVGILDLDLAASFCRQPPSCRQPLPALSATSPSRELGTRPPCGDQGFGPHNQYHGSRLQSESYNQYR